MNNNLIYLIISLSVILNIILFNSNKKNKSEKQIFQTESKIYFNKYNESETRNLVLNLSIKDLSKSKDYLNENNLELLSKIKKYEKEKSLLNATIFEQKFKLDSIVNSSPIISDNENLFKFNDSTENYNYSIDFDLAKKSLLINRIEANNKLYLSSFYNENKLLENRLINSNTNFTASNLTSIQEPEINKKKNKNSFFVGAAIGLIGGYLLFK